MGAIYSQYCIPEAFTSEFFIHFLSGHLVFCQKLQPGYCVFYDILGFIQVL